MSRCPGIHYQVKVNQRSLFFVVFRIVCGQLRHEVLKAESFMRASRSKRMYARPRTYDISVPGTPAACCRQNADQVASGWRRLRRLCWRGTPGTIHNEQRASRCTVYVGCSVIPVTSAVDAGLVSHGHGMVTPSK